MIRRIAFFSEANKIIYSFRRKDFDAIENEDEWMSEDTADINDLCKIMILLTIKSR